MNGQLARPAHDRRWACAATVGVPRAARDAGLRSYMLSVYNYMASGVLLTGIVALGFREQQPDQPDRQSGDRAGDAAVLGRAVRAAGDRACAELRDQPDLAPARCSCCSGLYAALVGVQFSTLFLVYTGVSIAQTFFATAAAFLGLSLYGYTTKRDLSGFAHVPGHGRGRHLDRVADQHVPALDRRSTWRSARSASCCSRASPPTTRRRSRASTSRWPGMARRWPRPPSWARFSSTSTSSTCSCSCCGSWATAAKPNRTGKKRGPEERSSGPFLLEQFRSCHWVQADDWQDRSVQAAGGKVAAKPGLTDSVLSLVKGTWLARGKHFTGFWPPEIADSGRSW